MDHVSLQQQKSMAEEKNHQTLKKVTKLLFSLSLFSFVFALPSWLPFHLFHSPNLHHFSPLSFHLFHQPIDKNCMFLLCNGLLVFLANYSGLFKSLSSSRRNYESFRVYDQFGPLSDSFMILEAEKPLHVRNITDVATIQERDDGYTTQQENKNDAESGHLASSTGGETEERAIPVAEGGDEEDNYGSRSDLFVVERAEVDNTTIDEEGNSGVLSDEELNRKFDEFIRRMKEEITIDARRTLVVV